MPCLSGRDARQLSRSWSASAGKFIVMEFPARIYRLERLRYFGYISDQQSLLGILSAPMAAFSFMTVFYTRNKMVYIRKPQQFIFYFSSSISKTKTHHYYSLYPWVSVYAENGLEGCTN